MKGAKDFMRDLPPTQRALFHLLHKGLDVPIARLYRRVHIEPREPRYQQQLVGAIISKLNVRLAPLGYRIKPGEVRRTYRMSRIPK